MSIEVEYMYIMLAYNINKAILRSIEVGKGGLIID
jgi:hypothetical protein